jgi:hypothetical protein
MWLGRKLYNNDITPALEVALGKNLDGPAGLMFNTPPVGSSETLNFEP